MFQGPPSYIRVRLAPDGQELVAKEDSHRKFAAVAEPRTDEPSGSTLHLSGHVHGHTHRINIRNECRK